jgi:hypothetical protein
VLLKLRATATTSLLAHILGTSPTRRPVTSTFVHLTYWRGGDIMWFFIFLASSVDNSAAKVVSNRPSCSGAS